jgi:signal peptidase I
MRKRRTHALVSTTILMVVAACLWYFFAPTALGGKDNSVVTEGVSMQPRFHAGDLAIIRAQPNYAVGEIVGYQSKLLHTVVLHRIIARNGNTYTFKGDNNDFIDPEHPTRSQLVGALWIHIPGAGTQFRAIGSPIAVGVLVGIGTLLLLGAAFAGRTHRRRRQARRGGGSVRGPPAGRPGRTVSPEALTIVLCICACVFVPAVILAIVSFAQPARTKHPYTIAYQQAGRFAYSSDTSQSAAYPTGHLGTGDPIFTQIIHQITVRFRYNFRAPSGHSVHGTIGLDVNVVATSGWHQTLQLVPPQPFRGDTAQVASPLDVHAVLGTISSLEKTTGVTSSYTLTLAPVVTVNGALAAQPLTTTFRPNTPAPAVLVPVATTYEPTLEFALTPLEMQSAGATSGPGTTPASVAATAAATTNPSTVASVTATTLSAAYLSLGPLHVRVVDMRWIALLAIAFVILGVAGTALLARGQARDERSRILARYGHWIVPVARVWQEPGVAVIDVNDMDALVRIADRYDRAILHEHDPIDGDAFWVTDESGQYRYAVPISGPRATQPDRELIYEPLTVPSSPAELLDDDGPHEFDER